MANLEIRIPALIIIICVMFSPLPAAATEVSQPPQSASAQALAVPLAPILSLNRTQLNFGSISGGVQTGPQRFLVDNSGDGNIDWTVQGDAAWISVNPTAGNGSHFVDVAIDPSGLSSGTYSGSVIVTDTAASNSPQTIAINLKVYNAGSTSPPFGVFSTPVDGTTVSSAVPFTGWALDDIAVSAVKIFRQDGGDSFIADAIFVDGARPDVEAAYPDYPRNSEAGWGYMMITNFLPGGGNGTFTFVAKAIDIEGNEVTLGTKTITVDNANAVKPFGTLDTPIQGGVASGTDFRLHGWVLTPQPNVVPTDGSTISIWIDGINIGHPTYNLYRNDIATLLPGYNNSDGAGFYLDLDTTNYQNGIHTIFATATDDAGNTDGIGARFFTINNPGAPVPVELMNFVIE